MTAGLSYSADAPGPPTPSGPPAAEETKAAGAALVGWRCESTVAPPMATRGPRVSLWARRVFRGHARLGGPGGLSKDRAPGLCPGQAEAAAAPPRAALRWTTQKSKNFKLNLYNTLIIYIAQDSLDKHQNAT